jgi:hypothetical protein
MPRSQNRRTIEVPVPLYEELRVRAAQEGTTIPAILQGLITDGQSMQAWFGQLDRRLYELRQEIHDLRHGLLPTTEDATPTEQPSV